MAQMAATSTSTTASTTASRPATADTSSSDVPNTQPGARNVADQMSAAIALAGTYWRSFIFSMPAMAGTKARMAPM